MVDTGTLNGKLVFIESESIDHAQANWAFLCAEDSAQTRSPEHDKRVVLDRLLETCLGAINHELRTPLALIFQTIEMLEDPRLGKMTDEQLDALTILRRQAQTLGQMIDGLLHIAAFVDKQATTRLVPASLEPVFENVLPLTEFKARSRGIAIETDIALDLPLLPMDVKQMEEALTQLLDNAVKFNRTEGIIKVTAQANDGWGILRVSDTGIGIEAKLLGKIWDVFEQNADPLRRAQEGLGVGLSIARYIVEAHHGTIEVETIPGQGSTFTVKLPITKEDRLNNQ